MKDWQNSLRTQIDYNFSHEHLTVWQYFHLKNIMVRWLKVWHTTRFNNVRKLWVPSAVCIGRFGSKFLTCHEWIWILTKSILWIPHILDYNGVCLIVCIFQSLFLQVFLSTILRRYIFLKERPVGTLTICTPASKTPMLRRRKKRISIIFSSFGK